MPFRAAFAMRAVRHAMIFHAATALLMRAIVCQDALMSFGDACLIALCQRAERAMRVPVRAQAMRAHTALRVHDDGVIATYSASSDITPRRARA